jgi:hypothetical protein
MIALDERYVYHRQPHLPRGSQAQDPLAAPLMGLAFLAVYGIGFRLILADLNGP